MRVAIDAYWGIGDVLLQTPAIALARRLLGPKAYIVHRTMEVPLRGQDSVVWGNSNINLFDTAEEYEHYPKVPEPVPWVDLTINLGGYQWYTMDEIAGYQKNLPHTHMFCDMLLPAVTLTGSPVTCSTRRWLCPPPPK